MITPKEAKELTLEVWRYLRDHPKIMFKHQTPMYHKINIFSGDCPLCAIYRSSDDDEDCKGCPLDCLAKKGGDKESLWRQHTFSDGPITRQKAASKIVELVEAWEV